jgi:SAM-dependent methyltransferase
MLSNFGKLSAVEMDAFALGEARKIAQEVEIQQGWLPHNLPFEGQKFGLVCLFDVLEHVEDDQGALNCVYERVEKGGTVILTVPAFQWLYGSHDKAHHHFRRYTATHLRVLAERAGFRVKRRGYFNTLLFPLVASLRLIGRVLGNSPSSDAAIPAAPVNWLLYRIFAAEALVVPYFFLPFGVSAIIVLEKP